MDVESFPPEIWGLIAYFLPFDCIGRLKLAGSYRLWANLCDNRAVKGLDMGTSSVAFVSLPAFVNELSGLTSLILSSSPGVRPWNPMPLKLFQFPRSLKKLKFNFNILPSASFFTDSSGAPLSLAEHLPHIEEIDATFSTEPKGDVWTTFPPNLVSLAFRTWNSIVTLPDSITDLKCTSVPFSSTIQLPKHLRSFSCAQAANYKAILPSLPSCLQTLSLPLSVTMEVDAIKSLPRGLKSLHFGTIGDASIDQLGTAWPPSLEHLRLFRLSVSLFDTLPRTLLSLRCLNPLDRYFASSNASGLSALLTLPSSLTSIIFEGSAILLTPIEEPGLNFMKNLKSLELNTASFDAGPQPLQRSPLDSSLFFPQHITSLKVGKLTETTVQHLPPLLTYLNASLAPLSDSFIQHLPKYLKSLIVGTSTSGTAVKNGIDPNEAKLAIWSDQVALPPLLQTFRSHYAELMGKNFTKWLPKSLLMLNLPGLIELQNTDIVFLTHLSIVYLDLSSCEELTGACFGDLPRTLTFFKLTTVSDIQDEHIKHLPPNLVDLQLPLAIHLTDACFSDFPTQLAMLRLHRNEKITQNVIPILPFKFQSTAYLHGFNTKNITYIDCVIVFNKLPN